jgi:hypothetical protein
MQKCDYFDVLKENNVADNWSYELVKNLSSKLNNIIFVAFNLVWREIVNQITNKMFVLLQKMKKKSDYFSMYCDTV